MFTWLLYLFPSLNFSTFILINTVVILINATAILVIKYKHGGNTDSKEKAGTKKKANGKSRKYPQKFKTSSPPHRKNSSSQHRAPQKPTTAGADQRGGHAHAKPVKTEGDESINTTLDEITWMSSNADDADAATRESKFHAGGQRLQSHRVLPQQKYRRSHPHPADVTHSTGGSFSKSTHVQRPLLHTHPSGGDPSATAAASPNKRPAPHHANSEDKQPHNPFNHLTITKPVKAIHERMPSPSANKLQSQSERQTSPLRKKLMTDYKVSSTNDASTLSHTQTHTHSAPRSNRSQDDPSSFNPCKSPKEKPPTPKSAQSSGWSSHLSNTKCDLCSGSGGGYQSLSSEHQIASNKSEASTNNLHRDSWIWFSSQCSSLAGNFAARQAKFRSTDPRVPKLLAEITKQDEMNKDIQREANSLKVSSPSKQGPHDIRKMRKAHFTGEQFLGCPMMRENVRKCDDKQKPEVEIHRGPNHKDVMAEETRYCDASPAYQPSPSPSHFAHSSEVTPDKSYPDCSSSLAPVFRPRVQLIIPKMRPKPVRDNAKDVSPQNFSSIVYNHHKQTFPPKSPPSSAKINKTSPSSGFGSRKDVFSAIDRPGNSNKSDYSHLIKSPVSCLFRKLPKSPASPDRHDTSSLGSVYHSPDTSQTSSLKHTDIFDHDHRRDRFRDQHEPSRESKYVQEKNCPPEFHSTFQTREESESDSLFIMSTSLETNGDKANQIGQEVSRTIKSIIFNNDSHSSTSNSKLGSSLQANTPKKATDVVQVTTTRSPSKSKRERKRIITCSRSPSYRDCRIDYKTNVAKKLSPPRKPHVHDSQTSVNISSKRNTPTKEKQLRKYVFGTSYYLSTRSQSQLKLCSSRSCTSEESCSKQSRYEPRAHGSRSANFALPSQRTRVKFKQ